MHSQPPPSLRETPIIALAVRKTKLGKVRDGSGRVGVLPN